MEQEEVEFAIIEGHLRAVAVDVEERYGGKYTISFTIEKVRVGEMG